MQYTKPLSANEPSELMWDVGIGGSSPYVSCACGKDHASPAEQNPDSNEWTDDHYFDYIMLNGHCFVRECDGCSKLLARYENFIWESRTHIRSYLKKRIDLEKEWADQEALCNTLAGI